MVRIDKHPDSNPLALCNPGNFGSRTQEEFIIACMTQETVQGSRVPLVMHEDHLVSPCLHEGLQCLPAVQTSGGDEHFP